MGSQRPDYDKKNLPDFRGTVKKELSLNLAIDRELLLRYNPAQYINETFEKRQLHIYMNIFVLFILALIILLVLILIIGIENRFHVWEVRRVKSKR